MLFSPSVLAGLLVASSSASLLFTTSDAPDSGGPPSAEAQPPATVGFEDLHAATLLRAMNLSPEALAASGVTSDSVPAVLSAALDKDNQAEFDDLNGALVEAKAKCSILQRKIRSGLASPDELATHAAVNKEMAFLQDSLEVFMLGLFESSTLQLEPQQAVRLANCRAQHTWTIPSQYKTVKRTEEELLDIRNAVCSLATSEALDLPPPAACSDLLQAKHAEYETSKASNGIQTNLASIITCWEDCLTSK